MKKEGSLRGDHLLIKIKRGTFLTIRGPLRGLPLLASYDTDLILDLIRPWVTPEKLDESIDQFRKLEF